MDGINNMEGWTRKAWGWYLTVYQQLDECVIQRLNVVKGGHSSKHFHTTLNNRMVCLEGRFQLTVWGPSSDEDATENNVILRPGLEFYMPHGIVHRFEALESSKVIEIVTVDDGIIDLNDITRFDVGGVVDCNGG